MFRSHGKGEFNRSQFKQIGKNVIFEKGVLVFHPENITIGDNVYIGHNTILKGYYKNELKIGSNTWIGQNCFFHSAGGIEIGDSVGIGPNVSILTSYHNHVNYQGGPIMNQPLVFKSVTIGEGCDIGVGTTILPGVTLEAFVLVGANSLVNSFASTCSVIAGNPAKKIKNLNNGNQGI